MGGTMPPSRRRVKGDLSSVGGSPAPPHLSFTTTHPGLNALARRSGGIGDEVGLDGPGCARWLRGRRPAARAPPPPPAPAGFSLRGGVPPRPPPPGAAR